MVWRNLLTMSLNTAQAYWQFRQEQSAGTGLALPRGIFICSFANGRTGGVQGSRPSESGAAPLVPSARRVLFIMHCGVWTRLYLDPKCQELARDIDIRMTRATLHEIKDGKWCRRSCRDSDKQNINYWWSVSLCDCQLDGLLLDIALINKTTIQNMQQTDLILIGERGKLVENLN